MRIALPIVIAGALMTSALPAPAQERKEPVRSFYRVDFAIRDGSTAAAKTGRKYSMMLDTIDRNSFRVGSRVPYITGTFQPAQEKGAGVSQQYSYADVGMNVDCRLREVAGGKAALEGWIELSSFVPPERGSAIQNPTFNSLRLNLIALMTPGKPAIVAVVDDPVTMRKVEVEATVSKVE